MVKVSAKKEMKKAEVKEAPKPKKHHNLCMSCHALPTGSIELVSLLLVLVFALSAVLLTSIYALEVQANHSKR